MKHFLFVVIVALMLLATACQAGPAPTGTPTPQPTSAPTFTRTPPPTWTPTEEPSPTPADTPTPAATPTPVPDEVWVSAAGGLNLRAEAKAGAKLVATLKQQQHLVALSPVTAADASGITWQNVRTDDGQTGWVSAQFLTKTNPAAPTVTVTVVAAATPPPASTPAPAAAAPTAAPAGAPSGEAWVNSAKGANLRSQAAVSSTVIIVIPFGAHVALTGGPQGPDAEGITWQNVRTDDAKTGFVSAQLLSATKPVTTTTPTPAAATPAAATPVASTPATATPAPANTGSTGNVWVVATNGLNLRTQANTTAAVVATLVFGQRLTALAPKGTPDAAGVAWQNVRTEASQSGWASAQYLAATPPVTTTTPPSGTVATTAAPTGTVVTNVANDLLQRINDLRNQNKVSAVRLNGQLATAAQRQSQDMAKTGNVSHVGSDGSLPVQRIGDAGYANPQRDEVIYGGHATVDDVWYIWTNERLQANVLLNPRYTEIGVAAVSAGGQTYYTITFGGP